MKDTQTQHTPGPWEYVGNTPPKNAREEGYVYGWYVTCADDRHISVEGRTGDEAEANARLIAAAPDMLEALESLVATIDFVYRVKQEGDTMDAARKAIAKATGEQEGGAS